MDWAKWLQRYRDENPMALEEWLLTEYRATIFRNCRAIMDRQILLHIDSWKNGHRNIQRVLQNDVHLLASIDHGPDCFSGRVPLDEINALLGTLLPLEGIDVRTASAILTVLWPQASSVFDAHVVKAMEMLGRFHACKDFTQRDYTEYMEDFWELAKSESALAGWSFRDIDRALWAYGKYGHD